MTSLLCSAREALEPFAEAAAHLHPSHPDDGLTLDCISVRAWRKAAEVYAALASPPPAETEEGVREAKLEGALKEAEAALRYAAPFLRNAGKLGTAERVLEVADRALAALSRGEAAKHQPGCHLSHIPLNLSSCACGLHHPESRVAIAAFLKSRDEALGPVGPEHTDEERLESADAILSLFSPQSLKASEKKEDHSQRAVPLSTISEGWRLDAERWRALMRCGRIKMQGSAGVDPETGERRNGSNVHFGVEFWPEQLPDDYRAKHPEEAARYDRSTRWGVACLTALADAIIEQSAPPALSEGGPDDRSDDQPA